MQLTFSGYHGKWHPTEQIPERVIGTAECPNAFCALDTSAIGETWRYVLSAGLTGDKWRASAWAQYYDWHMLSDSTYTQQINQLDRRGVYGGRYEYKLIHNARVTMTAGAEARYDDIGRVGLQDTYQGVYVSDVSKNAVKEGSISPYVETTWNPIDPLRLFAGLRADYYTFDLRSMLSDVHGSKSDSILSPKLGAAWEISNNIELYANWGRGFHSNDARGVVVQLTPDTPLVPGLVKGTGKEIGARFHQGNFSVTATYWWLDLESELKFSGDANAAEPSDPSKRRGYELVSFWRPVSWLAIDAVWTGSHARTVPDLSNPANIGHVYMEGAIESAGELGISAVQNQWELSARLRYLGPYPLTDDNAHRANGEAMLNLRGAWKTEHYTVYAELLNVLGDNGKDIVYWYEANAPGIDPPGEVGSCDGPTANCRMSRAEEPRTLRFGVRYQF
jgi:outer membrane receptor protein involved in Fe transport